MKQITFIAALLVAFSMNAQIYSEDFEATDGGDNVGEDTVIPSDYTSIDVDGDGFNWGVSNAVNYAQGPFADIYATGNFMVSASFITTGAANNGGNGALSPNNILTTPLITIPTAATDATLSYFVGSGSDPNFFSETYAVIVTTTNDEAAILAATPILETTLAAQGGETVTLDVGEFAGSDIFISFRHFDTTDEFVLGIDSIIVDGTLSLNDLGIFGFNYSVSNGEMRLRANEPLQSVAIYNLLGQSVLDQKLSSTNEVVSINALTTGVYVAQATIAGKTESFKIIKK